MLNHSRSCGNFIFKTWLAFTGATACWAASISSVEIQEQVVWGPPILGDSLTYDSGALAQNSLSNALNGTALTGSAQSSGSIGAGQVHGLAQSSGSASLATFAGFWNDGITVGGLPDGTPVTLLITDSLHSTVTAIGTGSSASAVSQTTIFFGGNKFFLDLSNTTSNLQDGLQTTSTEVTCAVSALTCFSFTEELSLNATAAGQDGQATADASNTNQIFIDVLTPGGTITSASGVGYSSAVPEPATAGPVLMALGGLLFVVRRNRGVGFGRKS